VILEDGRDRPSRDIRAALAREFSLTQDELSERLPHSTTLRFTNTVAWALHHLSRACLVERRGPSLYAITERGREVLAVHTTTVDIEVCAQFDEWHHSRVRRAARRRASHEESPTTSPLLEDPAWKGLSTI
jgi:restriction system protein